MNDIQVRFAEPRDADQIATLFGGSFCPEVEQLLIYGCRGAAEYIRMQMDSRGAVPESAFFVAEACGDIVAAIELRRQPQGLFLNYIAVDPRYRGQRVGAALLGTAIEMAGVRSGQIRLDVFHDNHRALGWYSRLGFASRAEKELLEVAPPGGAAAIPAYISGLPQADSCHERFGFSTFNLITPQGTVPVGRIGDGWFRLPDLAAVGNPAIFAALAMLDPGRRIFAVVPASSTPLAQVVRLLTKTHGMEAEIPRVMSSLSNDL